MFALQPHKSEDVDIRCQSRTRPVVLICRNSSTFWIFRLNPLLRNIPYLVIDLVAVLTECHSDGGMESGVSLEQIDSLLPVRGEQVPNLLEGEVIRELFEVRLKFLHEELLHGSIY